MGRIIHNGAPNWRALFDVGDDLGPGRLLEGLAGHFPDPEEATASPGDDARDAQPRGVGRWREIAGAFLDLSPIDRTDDDATFRPQAWRVDLVASLWLRPQGTRSGAPRLTTPVPNRTVFISHRQADAAAAETLAQAIVAHPGQASENVDVWLDVWDPLLAIVGQSALDADRQAFLTALIIEMALINASGVLVLMTDRSRGSAWIPYEYGRVRTGGPHATTAAACLANANGALPEYMLLGPRFTRQGPFPMPDDVDGYGMLWRWLTSL